MADLPVQSEVVVGGGESATPVSTSANFVVGGGCEGSGLPPTSVGKGRSLGVEAAPRCLPRFAPSPEVRNDAGYGANASPRRSEPQYGPYGFDDVPATSHSSAGQPHGHPPRAAFGPHSDAVHAGSGNFVHAGTDNSWGFRTGQAQFGPPGFPVFHGMAWQPSNPWLGPYASIEKSLPHGDVAH